MSDEEAVPHFSDAREVARFRLPISVASLEGLRRSLEASYGEDLVAVQEAEFLVIRRPRS